MTLAERLDELVRVEGDFVDHPADRGGPTRYGITLATLSAWRGSQATREDVRELSEEEARAIYTARYWLDPRFDEVAKVSSRIADELLDTGVNMHPKTAAEFLQRALNALAGWPTALYPDLVEDGAIGTYTLAALRAQLRRRPNGGEVVVLRVLNALQGARYVAISEGRKSQRAFVFGWFRNRVEI